MPTLRLGTRASALARWQAQWVESRLIALGMAVELVPITTRGDTSQRDSIADMGSPGVFTKELQRALLDGKIDLAVHSLKDLPTDEVDGLVLAAVPEREDPRDVLVSRHGLLSELPPEAVVGTGSLRRRAQLLHIRRDLEVRGIRGNVDTRLAKLAAGEYDAIVLARAGLVRLSLQDRVTEVFAPEVMLPAVGQGALALEARRDDEETRAALLPLNHPASMCAVLAERTLLAALAGGCLAPIGAWARAIDYRQLQLDAAVLSEDGQRRLFASQTASIERSAALGANVAAELIAAGASELIEAARHQP